MSILKNIADSLNKKIRVEKSIEDFENFLPRIMEKELEEDEWFQLYRIINLCEKCMKITIENLYIFDFSEFFFKLRIYNRIKYKDRIIKKFLNKKNFVEIRKFLELDINEVQKWDTSIDPSDLKKSQYNLFVKMILCLTKNDLKNKKFKKFLIKYIKNNNELKNYLYEEYYSNLKEFKFIKISINQKIKDIFQMILKNKVVVSIIIVSLAVVLALFALGLGIFGSIASILGLILSLYSLLTRK